MTGNTTTVKSFLQTEAWADFQRGLGRNTWHLKTHNWQSYVFEYDSWFGRNYLYLPHGPVQQNASEYDDTDDFVSKLRTLADTKTLFILAEPDSEYSANYLRHKGFRTSKKGIQPHATIIVDTTRPVEELQRSFHPKTRYNIRIAERYGIYVKETSDIESFLALLHKTTARDHFHSHADSYYRTLFLFFQNRSDVSIRLFMAFQDKQPLAAALVLLYDNRAYYLHGASDYAFRALMAPTLLHWHIMSHLHDHGFASYDLWGIDAKRYRGVTRFKSGWGGIVHEYPKSLELPIAGLAYHLYTIVRSLRSLW